MQAVHLDRLFLRIFTAFYFIKYFILKTSKKFLKNFCRADKKCYLCLPKKPKYIT